MVIGFIISCISVSPLDSAPDSNSWQRRFQPEVIASVEDTKQIAEGMDLRARKIASFGAGVVINYEFNEFVREQKDKRRYRVTLASLVVFFPACILLAWAVTHLVLGLTSVASSARLTNVVNRNVQIALATIQLNFESGEMAYAVLSGSRTNFTEEGDLLVQQNNTDAIIDSPVLWDRPFFPTDRPMYPSGQYSYTTYAELRDYLTEHRQDFLLQERSPVTLTKDVFGQWQWYRALTNDIYAQITQVFLANTDLAVWPNFLDTDYAVMFHRLLNHKRTLGTLLLYQGAVVADEMPIWYDLVGYISGGELLYASAFFMAPSFRRFVRNAQTNALAQKINWTVISDCETLIQNIEIARADGKTPFPPLPEEGDAYFAELTKLMEQVRAYTLRSSGRILDGLVEQEAADYAKCAWSAILLLVTLGGGFLNFYAISSFIHHFVSQVKKSAIEHRDKTLDLRMERRKTNMVLHTMLPRKVADELKFRKFVRPTYYDSVSMYFSDVQGFTALSSRSTPQDIVVMLTKLYTKFDDILDDYKVWKLETIGDAYCIIAGATNQHEFESSMEHAMEIVNCALAIRDHIGHYPIPHYPEETVKIRIGVHTGSVVAGVAGVGMHRYCVVGEALHVVEQVEASGKHGRVHISEDTKKAIFALPSSETLNNETPESDSINLDHPNSAVYICVANKQDELIKTYWIDRRHSDFARSMEGVILKEPRYDQNNLANPDHADQGTLLEHQKSLNQNFGSVLEKARKMIVPEVVQVQPVSEFSITMPTLVQHSSLEGDNESNGVSSPLSCVTAEVHPVNESFFAHQ